MSELSPLEARQLAIPHQVFGVKYMNDSQESNRRPDQDGNGEAKILGDNHYLGTG